MWLQMAVRKPPPQTLHVVSSGVGNSKRALLGVGVQFYISLFAELLEEDAFYKVLFALVRGQEDKGTMPPSYEPFSIASLLVCILK